MGEFLTEIFTGLILEGTIGKNIRYYIFLLIGKEVTKEQLANEVSGSENPHKQKNYNVLVGFLAIVFIISFVFGVIVLIFGNN